MDEAEGDRICSHLAEADVMFMANHGVLICAETVAHAFDDLYYLERACTVQVLAQSTGRPLRYIPTEVAIHTAQQFSLERQQSTLHFQALMRRMDRLEPGWSAE